MFVAATNSSRISRRFAALREAGELGLVAYITAGDPSLAATHRFVLALAEVGAAVIVVGADVIDCCVRFCAPLSRTSPIQRAFGRTLSRSVPMGSVCALVGHIRRS